MLRHLGAGTLMAGLGLCNAMAAQADDTADLRATYAPLLAQCLDETPNPADAVNCIGALSQECMSTQEGGETTLGMSFCMAAETAFWDDMLNDEYASTLANFEMLDGEDQTYFPEFANRVETLRAAQRAWITFRDAECALDYAIWGAGSMRHIAGNACMMQITAERALELVAKRELMQ